MAGRFREPAPKFCEACGAPSGGARLCAECSREADGLAREMALRRAAPPAAARRLPLRRG